MFPADNSYVGEKQFTCNPVHIKQPFWPRLRVWVVFVPAAAGLILAVGWWLSSGRSDVRLSHHISRLLCWMQLESDGDPLADFQAPRPNPVGTLPACICSFTWSPIEGLFIQPREAMRFIHAPIASASVSLTDSHTRIACGSCSAVHSPSNPSSLLSWYSN